MANETFPTPTDAAYIQRLRKDYPERCEGLSDEEVMNYYNPSGYKYVECTLWDHLGDAAYHFEKLAKAYLELKSQVTVTTNDGQICHPHLSCHRSGRRR